ncbi:type II toxin-antitoxin system VapC family toxin [Tundrisphaera lichenicola]|uniref:type II toxin-antitoxin system VapC family toxin n=1 Tax=Tundrisphaera lichenicola TaxID=2029860 RepID=UPI003EBD0542
MARIVILDTGVVGLLCCQPKTKDFAECYDWMYGMVALGTSVMVPDVVDYEIRRELIRLSAMAKLRRLGILKASINPAEVTPAAWAKAADFWAIVRRKGIPTAGAEALDCDSLLAGFAATIGKRRDKVTIATTNAKHLNRFPGIDARNWREIT